MNKLPVYNVVLGNAEGIQKMSLVDAPAVESDFLKFAEQHKLQFTIDEEQHIVFGCSLRADFPIYRYSPSVGEFYVVFSKEVIKELYEKFMIEQRFNDVNLNHETDTKGVYMLQSFLKDKDKGINPIGFEDIENGSWFTAYKIENEDVWQSVKSGVFNGFSVEGYFELEEPKQELKEQEEPETNQWIKEFDDLCNELGIK